MRSDKHNDAEKRFSASECGDRETDSAELQKLIADCNPEELAEFTAIAIRTMPSVERMFRGIWLWKLKADNANRQQQRTEK